MILVRLWFEITCLVLRLKQSPHGDEPLARDR